MFTYEQLTSKLRNSEDKIIGIGYSGARPDGYNNPSMQGVENVGPIPCGRFRIVGPPFDSPKHGKYVLHLVPDAATRAFILSLGRDPDTFLMHGDSIRLPGTASEGCVIQAHDVRVMVWTANAVDPYLEVISGIINSDVDGEISV
jgi:hypothetical protein